MWRILASLLEMGALVGGLMAVQQWHQNWIAAAEDRRLPALSVPPQEINNLAREAFEVICRYSSGPNGWVNMSHFAKERGWNERDIRYIFRVISPSLVKQNPIRSKLYAPTERGLNVYGTIVMHEPSEQLNIFANNGGFVGGVNIKSSGATAQAGGPNTAGSQLYEYRRVADSLHSDAKELFGVEGTVAKGYADDLAEAIDSRDQARADRLMGRIRELISSAGSAFSLTREVMDWLG